VESVGIFTQAMGSRNWPFSLALDSIFLLVVGTRANLWRANALQNRGYRPLGAMNARDPQDALAKVAASGGVIPDEMKAGLRALNPFGISGVR
jgi:hypothetical protein